jgi:hypothetical protein
MSVQRSNPRVESPTESNGVLRDNPRLSFDPRNLSVPLAVWCRSDLGITLNSADVSKWADYSGNGRDFAQASAADQPLFVKSGQGQRQEIDWDDHRMVGSDLYAMLTDKGEWTIFIVMGKGWQDSSTGASGSFMNSPNVITARENIGYVGIAVLSTSRGGFGGGIWDQGSTTYRDSVPVTEGKIGQGEPAVFALYSDSGGIKTRQNGVEGTTATGADLDSRAETIRLGDGADNVHATDYYDGPLSELLIFDGNLQSYEVEQLEKYLSERYDIGVR